MKDIILKIIGMIGYYPKRIKFRESTRYAKEIFKDKPIIVTEIGIDEGKNALNILQNLNVEKIYLIDPYVDYKDLREFENVRKQKYMDHANRGARNRLKKYKNKIVWVKEFSDNAVDKIPQCDYIYIDSNHHYPYIKKDLNLYFKKVKEDGILAGHDIEEKEVFKAVSEFSVKHKLNVWAFYPDWIIQKGSQTTSKVKA